MNRALPCGHCQRIGAAITQRSFSHAAVTEAIVTAIGPAIAKNILKRWLRDSSLAADVSSTLIDLLAKTGISTLSSKQGNRLFDRIGDEVAQGLAPFFEHEFLDVDDGEKNAVALAVGHVLSETPLTPEIIVERNLEPVALGKYLLAENPRITKDFSEQGLHLFKRIMSESCQAIVDIASQLPSFTEKTFAEVLKREDVILGVCKQILDEVAKIRNDNIRSDATGAVASFETDYCRAAIRHLDRLELFGVDVRDANRRFNLSVAYVSLSVESATAAANTVESGEGADAYEENGGDLILPVEQTLARTKRIVIRGEAGSGKTTLLQWLGVRSASKDFEGGLEAWNDTMPFFVRLRAFKDGKLPTAEDLPALLASQEAGATPPNWARERLKLGKALLLVWRG